MPAVSTHNVRFDEPVFRAAKLLRELCSIANVIGL